MTNDHEMGPLLRSWLHGTMVRPPDAHDSVRQVMARLPEPDETQRWRPLPSLSRHSLSVARGLPRVGSFSLSSAFKVVTAAFIVALFGGFLLAGALTTKQSDEAVPAAVTALPTPMTTDELLSGMVTEEVESGVLRIVNDGFRDLWHPEEASGDWLDDAVIAGGSGAVWRITPPRRLFRLGEEAEWSYDPGLVEIGQDNTEAGPDGRLWTLALGGLRVFDGGSWVEDDMCCDLSALAVGGDGTVWAVGDHSLSWKPPEWPSRSGWPDAYGDEVNGLSATDDGEVWLLVFSHEGDAGVGTLLRFDGTAWQVVSAPVGSDWPYQLGRTFDVGPDGTLWTIADSEQLHHSLARLDDSGWTVFTEVDGVQPWSQPAVFQVRLAAVEVAPDGSAWVNAADDRGDCDGVARFGGQTWTSYLTGRCISDFDIAPDGSVWVVARSHDGTSGVDTYVIRPEAVATVE